MKKRKLLEGQELVTAGQVSSWLGRATLIVLLLLVGAIEVMSHEATGWRGLWAGVPLCGLGVLVLLLRGESSGASVLGALLASLSVLLTGATSGTVLLVGGVPGWFSQALMLLFPFVFLHFSLVFPNASLGYERHRRLILAPIYGTYTVLMVLSGLQLEESVPLLDEAAILVIPLGFLTGLGILVRHYTCSSTTTEKNRLRIMLAGCLAGGTPVFLSKLVEPLPWLEGFALLLLPLFPLSLVLAVMKEDFAEPGGFLRTALQVALVTAGCVSLFFLSYLFFSTFLGAETERIWLYSAIASLLPVYPLIRWSGSYVGAYFPFPVASSELIGQAPGSFRPVSPNPFIVGNPVLAPEMFFGRKQDFDFVRRRLDQQDGVVLLIGERRAGKTSILYQIMNGRLGPGVLPVFVDLQEMVVQEDAQFVSTLAAKISGAAQTVSGREPPPKPGSAATYPELSELIDKTMEALGDSRLVLLFDEYELLAEKVRDGKIAREVYGYLSGMLERQSRLHVILTGSRSLSPDSASLPLVGKAACRQISFLALSDAKDLICAPMAGRVRFKGDAVGDILILTRGHPFFTQLICQTLVEVINDRRTNLVTRDCVEEAVARVLTDPPPQLLYDWSSFAPPEKLLLAGFAALVKRPAGFLAARRLERVIASLPEAQRHGLELITIRTTLEDLRRKGVLDRDRDRYRFTIDLLRRFIRLEHTVWGVLSEETSRTSA